MITNSLDLSTCALTHGGTTTDKVSCCGKSKISGRCLQDKETLVEFQQQFYNRHTTSDTGAVTFPALFLISSSAGLGLPGSCRPSLLFPPPHHITLQCAPKLLAPHSALQNYWHWGAEYFAPDRPAEMRHYRGLITSRYHYIRRGKLVQDSKPEAVLLMPPL